MAEGIYFTQAEYVETFGEDEAIRLTDVERIGAPDPDIFASAIADASADMDAYIGSRYALPLATVPRLLKSIAAALVREKLHTQFPTETVTREADRARKKLADLAAGRAVLLDAAGIKPDTASTGGDGIAYSAPSRVFTSDVLGRF